MATRRLAFIGSVQKGPPVAIFGMRNPVLRVKGLPQGLVLLIRVDDKQKKEIYTDGEFAILEGDWLLIHCSGICRFLICDVVSKVA